MQINCPLSLQWVPSDGAVADNEKMVIGFWKHPIIFENFKKNGELILN